MLHFLLIWGVRADGVGVRGAGPGRWQKESRCNSLEKCQSCLQEENLVERNPLKKTPALKVAASRALARAQGVVGGDRTGGGTAPGGENIIFPGSLKIPRKSKLRQARARRGPIRDGGGGKYGLGATLFTPFTSWGSIY